MNKFSGKKSWTKWKGGKSWPRDPAGASAQPTPFLFLPCPLSCATHLTMSLLNFHFSLLPFPRIHEPLFDLLSPPLSVALLLEPVISFFIP